MGHNVWSKPIRIKLAPFTLFYFGYMLIFLQDDITNLEGSLMNTFFIGTFDTFLVKLEMVKSIKIEFF